MLFNSAAFIFVFIPLVMTIFSLSTKGLPHYSATALFAASLAFYAYWDAEALVILAISICSNYAAGLVIDNLRRAGRPRRRDFALAAGITANLAALVYYKYSGFLERDILGLQSGIFRGVVLPLGISFFTFTQISYLVDVRNGSPVEPRFASYGLFVSYFPHLVAGPVLHHADMRAQFRTRLRRPISAENLAHALTFFTIGLAKKVLVADELSGFVNPLYASAAKGEALSVSDSWMAALGFGLQLYFDFSGYSDMAIGLSLLFGIWIPINFNSPYKAADIIDFWRRWHISLSAFLRDYLYKPLGGNRRGEPRRYFNIFVVMVVGGIWHGAGFTYLLWGAMHGVLIVLNHLWRAARTRWALSALPRPLAFAGTFICVMIAWVMFRAPSVEAALTIYQGMAGLAEWGTVPAGQALLLGAGLAIAWFAPNSQQIIGFPSAVKLPPGLTPPPARALAWRPNFAAALACGGVFAMCLYQVVVTKRVTDFLYFQF